ncbi:Bug family tripartite tricarboxylate transporter substrate binding protein [Marinomonas fungiae]|uniref:Tripartite-type tricarboxylate transporter, receptor component TctC n=1 Tax=Marinomonas fungiae TaxID=1137284 RepID=A0A0K6ITK8_9GAMM|nr:tripartite tricarboxylate transporter substrate-binding protein [Marinomonas fungiae]CUB06451.1 Tripartite-type tricarboxylate transporter, receptor component TctC [Marinomonas fungiae]
MKTRTKTKLALATASLIIGMTSGLSNAAEPLITGKVDCIAPAGPGGGWDFTCRSIGRLLNNFSHGDLTVQTLNMPGAGGGVGFAHMITKRSHDPKVLAAASTATTARLAQNQFPGMSSDMVRWVGAIGTDPGIIAVSKDSDIDSLATLITRLKNDPSSLTFAGASAIGGWDHLKILMTAHSAGLSDLKQIKYLSYNNGGSAVTQVVGGHIDVLVGVASSTKGFIESGDLKPLAVLGHDRLSPPLDSIPTSFELGLDVEASNWRGFYMPKEVPEEAYQWWVNNLKAASQTDEWKQTMVQNGLEPFSLFGEDFDQFVNKQVGSLATISKEIGIIK